MKTPSASAHWRDSARPARFFFVDARAAFPLFIFLMHITFWTGAIAITTTLFFAVIERYGFTAPVFLRVLRGLAAGRWKVSRPWWTYYY